MKRDGPRTQYQKADIAIVDYGYEILNGASFPVRGPLAGDSFAKRIACLGSAATFGRFAARPFSAELAELLGAHVINFGAGGARPETYLHEPAILGLCQTCDLVIIELMSARSYGSDLFAPSEYKGKSGSIGSQFKSQVAETGGEGLLRKRLVTADKVYRWAARNLSWVELLRIREQLLDRYVRDVLTLIERISRPALLLWFSQRSMDEIPLPGSYPSWARGFPHFLDRRVADAIAQHAVGLVDVTSRVGIPAPLVPVAGTHDSNSTSPGRHGPKTSNSYYPSPEMHAEAARRLAAFIAPLWRESHESFRELRGQSGPVIGPLSR